MSALTDGEREVLRDLAQSSDPEPATAEDEREARAAYEAATSEAAAMVRRAAWEGRDG